MEDIIKELKMNKKEEEKFCHLCGGELDYFHKKAKK